MKTVNYDNVRQFFNDLGRDDDAISAIVEFGTRRADGLSDIDIMVIVRTAGSVGPDTKWSAIDSYPPEVRQPLDGGAVKIVTEEQFSQLPLLGAMNVRPVFGESIPQISFDNDRLRLIRIADVMDWLAERIVTLRTHVRSQGAHATRAINCAYSITHTFQRAAEVKAITEHVAETYRHEVDTFRSLWRDSHELANRSLVAWLTDRLGDASLLSVRIGAFVEGDGYYSATPESEKFKFRFNNGTLGFSKETKGIADDAIQNTHTVVPAAWFTHLAFQSRLDGLIPEELSRRIHWANAAPEVRVAPELGKVLSERMGLCNSIASMLLPVGMRDNIYRFGHLLDPSRR